jgi:hypothetical protein
MTQLLYAIAIGVAAWSVLLVLVAIHSERVSAKAGMEELLQAFVVRLADRGRERMLARRRVYGEEMEYEPAIYAEDAIRVFGER